MVSSVRGGAVAGAELGEEFVRHLGARGHGGVHVAKVSLAGQARLIGCTLTYMNAPGGGAQVRLTFAEEAGLVKGMRRRRGSDRQQRHPVGGRGGLASRRDA